MKRISISLLIVVLSVQAKSQVNFGVQAGINLANISYSENGRKQTGKKTFTGFKIGAVASVPLTREVSFMPEVNFVRRGGMFSNTATITLPGPVELTTRTNEEYIISFIEVPLNIAYNKAGKNGNRFFVGLGPVLSYGINGEVNVDATITQVLNGSTNSSFSERSGPIHFDGEKNVQGTGVLQLQALELGGNVFAGYKFRNGFLAKAGYTMGFSDLIKDPDASFKTSYFGISIGYFFGSK